MGAHMCFNRVCSYFRDWGVCMSDDVLLEQRLRDAFHEMPLVEIAYEILTSTNEPFYYRDLMAKVAETRHLTPVQVDEMIARLYTDINIDGRFLCTGDNVWGLKRWYPVERTGEKSAAKRFLRKDAADFDDDDDVLEIEEEELLDEDPPFDFTDDDGDDTEVEPVLEDDIEFIQEDAEGDEPELEEDEEDHDEL